MGSVQDIAPPWLTFYRAEQWGVIWKRPPVAEGQADPETYIHHGAGGRYGTDPQQAMRSLQKWYHDVKDYSTIAYDVMVHRNTSDNTIAVLGAREGWLSAATSDRNDIGEAICLFGYFHPGHALSEQPTAREIEGLAYAVAWSIEQGWSATDTKVMGHRDNPAHPGATGCPGDYLYPHVGPIGRRALQLIRLANDPKDTDMITLDKPRRAYDSRLTGGPFMPGETRSIYLGPISEAFICVTADSRKGSGFISINDPVVNSKPPSTSVVNYDGNDRLESNAVPVKAPGGNITVTNMHGVSEVIIDVFAQK